MTENLYLNVWFFFLRYGAVIYTDLVKKNKYPLLTPEQIIIKNVREKGFLMMYIKIA